MADERDVRIDGDRLWQRLEALGEIGAVHGPNGERGCARLALTDADRDGRDLVVSWMRDLDMQISIDAIGNVIATRAGSDPTAASMMVGSHIDTVRTGGRFDGNLGVLAGLEIVESLAQHDITTRRPIQVAFFTDEEGARFAPDMMGSLVYVGGLAVEEALDVVAADDGARLGDELTRIGYAGPTPVPAASFPYSYAELHIEQGPVLEDEGTTIGVVTGVQGISWTEVTVTGQSAHAGTTPMQMRRDPLAVAARAIHEVRLIAGYMGAPQVATVGRLDVVPNLVNVVPSNVVFTIDLRNTDDARLKEAEAEVFAACRAHASDEGCEISMRTLARFEPVEFDKTMIDLVESTAQRLGHSTRRLPSGAGHDAQMLARVCPTSMIFVPSVDGLSHNIAEYTTPADIEAGANVLLHVVLDRAAQ
jgi:N-carbamoyl-L-amino-acid hydrolase